MVPPNVPTGATPDRRPEAEPPKTRLGRILAESPESRPRLSLAVGSLLATTLVALAALGILLIWHLRRRADLIRDRLGPFRDLSLPDPSELKPKPKPTTTPKADPADSP